MLFTLFLLQFIEWNLKKNGCKTGELPIHPGACGPFILTGPGGYRQVQTPRGKLFAFDTHAKHVLTCATNGGLVYSVCRLQNVKFFFILLNRSFMSV